jgi:hypothetical protein
MQLGLNQVRRRQGMMLLEAVVYGVVFFLILSLAGAAFARALDQSQRLRRNAADISLALEAGERWRADVRAATAPPRLVQEGPIQALHLPQPQGEVVYFLADDTLLRRANSDAPWIKVLGGLKSAAFCEDTRTHVTSWRWEFEFKSDSKRAKLRPWFCLQAVPQAQAKP